VRTLVTLVGNGEGERFTQGSRRRTRRRNSSLTASREGRDEGRYEAQETFHRSSAVRP
jgi:hypothetical protein